jgi:hypothetical protein
MVNGHNETSKAIETHLKETARILYGMECTSKHCSFDIEHEKGPTWHQTPFEGKNEGTQRSDHRWKPTLKFAIQSTWDRVSTGCGYGE